MQGLSVVSLFGIDKKESTVTEAPQENTAAPTENQSVENQPAETYPAAESLPIRQRAVVATDRPARYIKQLGSHMGRKLGTAELPDGLRLTFNRDGIFRGYGDLRATDGALVMEVRADSDEQAAGLADVLDRHLVRFGERDELVVNFEAVPAS